jgi:hypothetical protein
VQLAECFVFFGARTDGDEMVSGGMQCDSVDQASALEEGGLAMYAASVVFVPLAYVNDAAFGCLSELEAGLVN